MTFAPQNFDEATGELKDEPTREMIRTHLKGFAAFVAKVTGKSVVGRNSEAYSAVPRRELAQ